VRYGRARKRVETQQMTPPTGMTQPLMLYLAAVKVSTEGIRTTAVLQAIEVPAVDDEGLLRYIDLCFPVL
jgi:hypothetical protein